MVQSYYGNSKFTINEVGSKFKYNEVNIWDYREDGLWEAAGEGSYGDFYRSTYSNGVSSQFCGAVLPLKITQDGTDVPLPPENTLKFGTQYIVTSGWKTWTAEDSANVYDAGDGAYFTTYLWQPDD